ncbi:MAG: phosphotransferase [Silicimonas sp.]|nr:phosphotransferase [Silicimonas sp.]
MGAEDMPLEEMLGHIGRTAHESLSLWPLPEGARLRLINVSENATYLVEAPGMKTVLRVHRAGYHSRRAIECELDWMAALGRDTGLVTPEVIVGCDGAAIQEVSFDALGERRFLVMFAFLEGAAPEERGDLRAGFEELGRIAATCHDHALDWPRPDGFERLVWDEETVFGADPTWGNWRSAPGVTAEVRATLEAAEARIRARLAGYGKPAHRFNLIHADMRLANLLTGPMGTRLIDFDDCGLGWLMYDFAAAISFLEDDPRVPGWRAAWLRGYRTIRALAVEDEAEIDTMIMLRRMALLAWIGSHIEAPEPQALAPDFARRTEALARIYLDRTA